jgi:hypothetical protein
MKQISQSQESVTEPTPPRDRTPTTPFGAISDADLDMVSGGGGKAGGVVGSRGHARD